MPTTAQEAFEALVARDLREPGVSLGKMFGSNGLKIESRVFAMLVKGNLVVKLPRQRVERLQMAGIGRPFDPGHGRVMKEWVAISTAAIRKWRSLAAEAREFVRSGL